MKETNIEIAGKSYKMSYTVNEPNYSGTILGIELKFSFTALNGLVMEYSPINLHASFILRLYQKILLNETQA